MIHWFLLQINDRQCPIIIKRSDRRIAKAIKKKGILAKDVFDVVMAMLGLGTNWAIIVPCKAQIQEKLHKNHTKSYYIPVTHSASLSDHPRDIIL